MWNTPSYGLGSQAVAAEHIPSIVRNQAKTKAMIQCNQQPLAPAALARVVIVTMATCHGNPPWHPTKMDYYFELWDNLPFLYGLRQAFCHNSDESNWPDVSLHKNTLWPFYYRHGCGLVLPGCLHCSFLPPSSVMYSVFQPALHTDSQNPDFCFKSFCPLKG